MLKDLDLENLPNILSPGMTLYWVYIGIMEKKMETTGII